MRIIIKRLIWMAVIASCMASAQALSKGSFEVSGTLDNYADLKTGAEYSDYTFSATVSYEVPDAPDETYIETYKEQSFFYDAITSIDYSIYDEDGNLVTSGVETGNLNNITSVLNDLDFSDHIREQIYWYADDPLSTVESQAVISFYDSTGNLVDDAEDYPEPPKIDDVDYGAGTFYRYDSGTGEGLNAWGRITEVSYNRSFSGCSLKRNDGRGVGRYIRCLISVFKDRKSSDRFSREEFRKHFVNNHERREDYLKCLRENRSARNSFVRCFAETRRDHNAGKAASWKGKWRERKQSFQERRKTRGQDYRGRVRGWFNNR